jgi:hypothetical protein
MLGNPQVLTTPSILIECTGIQKLCMGLSKCRGHGILGLKLSYLIMSVMGSVDKTLFTLKHGNDSLLVQIYINDIIFGGSSCVLVSSF